MGTVTGFTADRMLAMEDATVVDGNVVGDNLILLTKDGTAIDAGSVRGPQGIQGIPGEVTDAELAVVAKAPYSYCQLQGSTASGSFTTIALSARTTNDSAMFGGTDGNNMPILSPGLYQIDVGIRYLSTAAIGAKSTYLHVELRSSSAEIDSSTEFVPGDHHKVHLSGLLTVTTAEYPWVRHADTAGRSVQVQVSPGSYMRAIRLGDA